MSTTGLYKPAEKMFELLNYAREHNRRIPKKRVADLEKDALSPVKPLVSLEYVKEVKKDGVWFYSIRSKGLNLFGEKRLKGEISPDVRDDIIKKLEKDLKKLDMKPWEVMLQILQLIGKHQPMNTEEIITALRKYFPQLKGTSRANIYRIIQRLRMKGYIAYEKMVYSEQSSFRLGESAQDIMSLSISRALQALHTVEEWDTAMKEVFASMEEDRIQKEEALFTIIDSIPRGLTPQQTIWILYMRGAIYELKRRLDKAEAEYLHMEELSEEMGDTRARSYSLKGLGNVAFKRTKYGVANRYYSKCQKIAEPLHDDLLSSDILNNLGSCLFMKDDVEEALQHFNRALDLTGDDRCREAFILCNQGLCYARMEQLKNARKLWEKSLHLYEDLHDIEGMQIVQHNLREIDHRQKREYLEEQYHKAMERGTTEDKKKAYEDLVRFQFHAYMEKGGMSS
jgi:tetratricopeptide (TPR) repeat protein